MTYRGFTSRLANGSLWTDLALRGIGGAALLMAFYVATLVRRIALAVPANQATIGEFAGSVALVLSMSAGLALITCGRRLFAQVPLPPRPF